MERAKAKVGISLRWMLVLALVVSMFNVQTAFADAGESDDANDVVGAVDGVVIEEDAATAMDVPADEAQEVAELESIDNSVSSIDVAPLAENDPAEAAPQDTEVSPLAKKYTITKNYSGGANGTVTVIKSANGSPATLYPVAGATVTFRTSPKVGYTLTRMSYTDSSGKTVALKRISGTGKPGTNSVYSFKMPAKNVTLNATFAVNKRNITKSVVGAGSLTIVNNPDGTKGSLYPQVGKTVTFKAAASSGYSLQRMFYVPTSTGQPIALKKVAGTASTYQFKMPNSNVKLVALYALPQSAEMLSLLNGHRNANGKASLTMDSDLQKAAMIRAQEIATKFSHTRPNGSEWYTVCDKAYGENIAYAYGYTTTEIFNKWKASSSHNKNMLDGDWKGVGIGYYSYNGKTYWVQLFSPAIPT